MNFTDSLNHFNDIGYSITFFNVLKPFGIKSVELPFVIAVVLFGIFYINIKTRFYGIVNLKKGFWALLKAQTKGEGVSPVKAMFSAVAGATGIGNTAGIAGLIAATNPGSVFWILVAALLCNSFKFVEILLSHKFRDTSGHSVMGGPFRYIPLGLKEVGLPRLGKFLGGFYLLTLLLGAFGGPSILQSNQIAQIIGGTFHLQAYTAVITFVVSCIVLFVILGGTTRVVNFLSFVLPFLISTLLFGFVLVIGVNFTKIPEAISIIFKSAFSFSSAGFGMFTFMVLKTLQRISLSTETTLGTTAILHSASKEQDSVKEATTGMVSPVVSGFLVSFMTALVVIVSGAYKQDTKGILTVSYAFGTVSKFLPYVLTVAIPLMALNVIIAWSYYGVKASEFAFGKMGKIIFIALYVFVVFLGGCVEDFDIVFKMTDILNTSMSIPNVLAIVLMFNKVVMPLLKKKNK